MADVKGSEPTGDAIADVLSNPDFVEKFNKVMGNDEATATVTRRDTSAQDEQEELESLDSLEGSEDSDELANRDFRSDDEGTDNKKAEADAATSDDTDSGDSEAKDKDDLTLPHVLHQAAKRSGMSDDEIEEFHKANPELAERTFRRLHDNANNLSSQYAKLGKQAMDQGDDDNDDRPPRRSNRNVLEEAFGADRAEEVRSNYGELADGLESLLERVARMEGYHEAATMAAIRSETTQFFNGIHKDYHDLYGNSGKITSEQHDARSEMATLADQIRAGAESQGINLSVTEALERANSLYSAPHIETLARKRIVDQVRNRSKTVTQRPTQRRRHQDVAPRRSKEAAIQAVTEAQRELGML